MEGTGMDAADNDLKHEIAALRKELEQLNNHRFIRIQNSVPRLIGFQFLRGLALGLGTVVGASVLVSIVGYFLAQIDFLPIIGDWAVMRRRWSFSFSAKSPICPHPRDITHSPAILHGPCWTTSRLAP